MYIFSLYNSLSLSLYIYIHILSVYMYIVLFQKICRYHIKSSLGWKRLNQVNLKMSKRIECHQAKFRDDPLTL